MITRRSARTTLARGTAALVVASIAVGSGSDAALATSHVGQAAFAPPPPNPPTIGEQPPPPERRNEYDQSIGISYDDATGAITVTLAEYASDYWGGSTGEHLLDLTPLWDEETHTCSTTDDGGQAPNGLLHIRISGPGAESDAPRAGQTPRATAFATVVGIDGEVQASRATFDGRQFTFVLADPHFAGQQWRCMSFAKTQAATTAPPSVPLSGWPLSDKVYLQSVFPIPPQVAPQRFPFNRDETGTRLRWVGWGGPTATATGVGVLNNCLPSCGSGHTFRRHIHVSASRIHVCLNGSRQYTLLSWRYTGRRARGIPRSNFGYARCGGVDWLGNQRNTVG